MTYKEWNALGLPMVWCIWVEAAEDVDDDLDNLELDLTTTAPDGTYDVEARGGYQDSHFGHVRQHVRIRGVEVQHGRFVPEFTARACYAARALASGNSPHDVAAGTAAIDHIYIEGLDYDPEERTFRLVTGS